ncbi:SPOR domain-containing protein [Vibrio astriarenae]|uniref:SPOR domain-containing protein n=1 Tax=Vibrio astriarenae TaxID=1481923 RepID=A0A7Z2T538_9VIBR|nr:SPOR domain-containing protein [Vibrio astriarenae]QIA64574.1 SPOR domain-containing protein [Vibrio astriarenae]
MKAAKEQQDMDGLKCHWGKTAAMIGTLCWGLASSSAVAQDFLCDATQASNTELAVLNASCPVGDGLWGKQQPKKSVSIFWIQCGIFPKPLTLKEAKPLYDVIKTDVWAKPEKSGARCLIGPYKTLSDANADLRNVKKVNGYKEAFVRAVYKQGATTAAPSRTASKPKPKPAAPMKQKPQPSVQASQPVAIGELPQAQASQYQSEVAIRLESVVNGLNYAVPYLMFSDEQFYMEHGLPWTRLNYASATKTCQQLKMRLPSGSEWQQFLKAKIMDNGEWPVHLPYWGEERKGLFTSGQVNQLSGKSLLNVMCVR